METVYKLTDKDNRTRPGMYNETFWGEGVTHTELGAKELCGPGWIHAYTSPILAVLLNRAHANFDEKTMQLWGCQAEVGLRRADKIGCTVLTTVKKIDFPVFTLIQKQAFAILVAKAVYREDSFQLWADGWLSGKDRSANAAYAAYAADLDLIAIAKEALKYE